MHAAAAALLIVLMPLTVLLPVAPPVAAGVLPLYVTLGIELSEVAALLVVLVAWIGRATVSNKSSFSVAPLLAIGLLATALSPVAMLPQLAAYSACRWLLAAAVCWSVARLRLSFDRLTAVMMVSLAIHVLIGAGQVVQQGQLGLPAEWAIDHGQEGAAVLALQGGAWLRPYGLTFHPNVLAGFLVVGLVLGLPMVGHLGCRALWWILWFGLLLTFSRSAWLGMLISAPIAAGWLYRREPRLRSALWRTALGACAILLLLGWVTGEQIEARFFQRAPIVAGTDRSATPEAPVSLSSEESISDRLEMIDLSLQLIASHPFFGIGAGNFPLAMLAAHTKAPPQYVHNVPLLIAAEAGCAAGVIWLGLWGGGAYLLWRDRNRLSAWMVVLVCAWLALGVIALFDSYPWALASGRLLTATVLGLSAAAYPRSAREKA